MMKSDLVLDFLKKIAVNNNRPYFNEHKEEYLAAKTEFEEMTERLIVRLATVDPTLKHLTAKDCCYRFYRDIRFSPDKAPYKRHLGAYLCEGGKKSLKAGYYLHLQPGATLLACGQYMLDKKNLVNLRDHIYNDYTDFRKIIDCPTLQKAFEAVGAWEGERLKKVPRGFDATFEGAEYLKWKSCVAVHKMSDEEVLKEGFEETVYRTFATGVELNHYLNEIYQEGE